MKKVLNVVVDKPVFYDYSYFKGEIWTFIKCSMPNNVLKQFVELGFGLARSGNLFKKGFYRIEINDDINSIDQYKVGVKLFELPEEHVIEPHPFYSESEQNDYGLPF